MTDSDGTNTSDTTTENMTTMGRVETSDLMMMIRWVKNISMMFDLSMSRRSRSQNCTFEQGDHNFSFQELDLAYRLRFLYF